MSEHLKYDSDVVALYLENSDFIRSLADKLKRDLSIFELYLRDREKSKQLMQKITTLDLEFEILWKRILYLFPSSVVSVAENLRTPEMMENCLESDRSSWKYFPVQLKRKRKRDVILYFIKKYVFFFVLFIYICAIIIYLMFAFFC